MMESILKYSLDSSKHVLVIGTGKTAEVYLEYLKYVFNIKNIIFARDNAENEETFHNYPVVNLLNPELTSIYSTKKYQAITAISSSNRNLTRESMYNRVKKLGYSFFSVVYPDVRIWPSNEIGENTFIFEKNNLQPYVKVGNNVVLWSGNHIGHHSVVEDSVFISSHVVVSGNCRIGKRSFLGVNCSIGDGVYIKDENWISPGVVITKDTKENSLYFPTRYAAAEKSTSEFFDKKKPNTPNTLCIQHE